MIVKFFTHGTGGSKGVFDYLLNDKEQPDGKRLGAEVLRGDIDNQALLIDSLDFKQKYTSGCLSFTETADEVTAEQKNTLMDGFEETLRAGLDVDRVSVSWIEHRDKGRLELNFVFADVDLEHGRAFQPYIHYQDKRRVNAWKDMQNIEYGFTDPNDPANKRLMAQRDNLPRDIKDARQAITDGLKALVVEGVIASRDDVIQALTDGGFEIARETDKAISIKNPDPTAKRNIRLTGGLYERGFKFSREVQSEITAASESYRARSTERYDAAKQLYESEIKRKRDYHQARHGQPRHEQRAVANHVVGSENRYRYSPYDIFRTAPTPFVARFRTARKRHTDDDRGIRSRHRDVDTETRRQASQNHQVRNEDMGDLGFLDYIRSLDTGHHAGGVNNKQSHKADLHLQAVASASVNASAKAISPITAAEVRINHGQETARASAEGITSAARHDRAPRENVGQQRRGYSEINSFINQVGRSANAGATSLAEQIREFNKHDEAVCTESKRMESESKSRYALTRDLDERVNNAIRHADKTSRAYEQLSEYDSTARTIKQHHERIRDDIERAKDITDYNKDYAERNKQFAGYNRQNTKIIDQGIERIRDIKKIAQEHNQPEPKPSNSSPRMGW